MKDIFISIKRTPFQSLASFMILFSTLLLALFFFFLTSFFTGILSYVETRPQVIAYFAPETSNKKILEIKAKLEDSKKTSSINYVSQQEALSIYKNMNKDNPLLVEMVSADILPASLEIYALKPEYLEQIAQYLEQQNEIEEVNYQKDIVNRLLKLTDTLRKSSLIIFSYLLIITIIVQTTTTAFKIALKKDDIELYQLLGATKWYIRKPFIIEGIVFGTLTSIIACTIFYGILFYFTPTLKGYLMGIPDISFYGLSNYQLYVWPPSLFFVGLSFLIVVFFGSLIMVAGNLIATSKYIK